MIYRKKPVLVEAICFVGGNGAEVVAWTNNPRVTNEKKGRMVAHDLIRIETLEGVMMAMQGDWIIRGVKGELYPCKPEIFSEIYEAVSGLPVVVGKYCCLIGYTDPAGVFIQVKKNLIFNGNDFDLPEEQGGMKTISMETSKDLGGGLWRVLSWSGRE